MPLDDGSEAIYSHAQLSIKQRGMPLDDGSEAIYSHAQLSIKQRVRLLLAGHAPDGPVKHCVRCHLAEGGKPEH